MVSSFVKYWVKRFGTAASPTGSVGGRFVNRPYDYALKKPSIGAPFAVPGALLAEVAAASLTDRVAERSESKI